MNKATLLLKKLVEIPSFVGSANPASEVIVTNFIKKYFHENFPEFKQMSIPFEGERANLIVKNANHVNILFACHMDTVPPSSKTAFRLTVKGDKAFGLGTKDMKGGIAATILALHNLKSIPQGVGILFYGDEENTFKGITKIVQNSKKLFPKKPTIIISPESRFNLGIGARGIIVAKFQVFGKRAHSARPQLGIDAIKLFVEAVSKVETQLNKKRSELGKTTLTISRLNAGLLQPDGSIGHHVGTIPDYAEAIVSVRNAVQDLDGKKLTKILQGECGARGLRIKSEIMEDYPARIIPKVQVKYLSRIIAKAGFKPEIADPKLAGFNDVALLAKALNCSVVNFGPYGEGNHTRDEWVSIKSIERTAKVFEKLIIHITQ